jgi:hypothetical protein
MRSIVLKATVGLFVTAGIMSIAKPASATYYEWMYGADNNVCLGVAAGNMTNGTHIITWSCNAQYPSYTGARDQAWYMDVSDVILPGERTTIRSVTASI